MAFFAAIAAMLAAFPCSAFDASRADIAGLRLEMPETEALAAMHRQGFAVTHDHGALIARTDDGRLTADLDEEQTIREIRYVYDGSSREDMRRAEETILNRFGPPDQTRPMGWCLALTRDLRCADDGPRLTFMPETLTLMLQSSNYRP